MAVTQNPIIGRAKGSIGNTVFSTWKGKNVIRLKPLEVKPSNTPEQEANRWKLRVSAKSAAGLRNLILRSLSPLAIGKTVYNVAVQRFLPKVQPFEEVNPDGRLSDFPSVIAGSAAIAQIQISSNTAVGNNQQFTLSRALTAEEQANYDPFILLLDANLIPFDAQVAEVVTATEILYTPGLTNPFIGSYVLVLLSKVNGLGYQSSTYVPF